MSFYNQRHMLNFVMQIPHYLKYQIRKKNFGAEKLDISHPHSI